MIWALALLAVALVPALRRLAATLVLLAVVAALLGTVLESSPVPSNASVLCVAAHLLGGC